MLDRDEHDAAAARLDGVSSDDLVGGPVRALDENVRLKGFDDLGGIVLVKDYDGVDRRQRGQHFRSLLLGRDRTGGTLVPAHRCVRVEAENQGVGK